MFRVKASEIDARIPSSAAVVLITLVLASVLSVAAVYQVLDEYRLLGEWVHSSRPVSTSDIRSLRQDIGTRIIVRSAALVLLVLCTVATLWLQQRQFAIRRTLNQIKMFARDILASMDEGVITTDCHGTITSVNSAAIEVLGIAVRLRRPATGADRRGGRAISAVGERSRRPRYRGLGPRFQHRTWRTYATDSSARTDSQVN